MNGKRFLRAMWCQRWAAVVLALSWAGWAGAQSGTEPARLNLAPARAPDAKPTPAAATLSPPDGGIVQVGCSTCGGGGGGLLRAGPGSDTGTVCDTCRGGCACGEGGCCGTCVPGRINCCSDCAGRGPVTKFLCGLYCCLCCPDPCYEPCWIPQANASFFVDSARPVTQMRIRWDSVLNYTLPDRSEFFWGQIGKKGPGKPEIALRYNDLAIYTETAITPLMSMFSEFPYRALDPDANASASGFADMNLGVKTLLFDCDLLQVAFQFRTYLPMGNFNKGLGTGHVSLEPALLATLKLTPDTYLQAQLADFIPIAGSQSFAGPVLHYHFSLNHVLHRILPDVPVIGTFEGNFYSFLGGNFTPGGVGDAISSTYASFGPGLRVVVCKRIDIGIGSAFAVGDHGPGQTYRTEFRWRF